MFHHFIDDLCFMGKQYHAQCVYRKCLRVGKFSLADRIARKYGLFRNDDLVMAFGISLMCQELKKNKDSDDEITRQNSRDI